MGTEDFKHGVVSLLLAFALVFSMISVAPPASPGELIIDPGGTTIEVVQGDNFLIRHVLEWNEPEDGAYGITMAWDCYDNKPSENFTFVGAEAYFDLDNDNLPDPELDPILAEVTWLVVPSPDYPGSTRYILTVECPADKKDSRNGQFNVDITLSASGVGGVPHILGDHVIPFQAAGIIIIEASMKSWNRDPITIRVLELVPECGVDVTVEPKHQRGTPDTWLTFIVRVHNTGDIEDNYLLSVVPDGWPMENIILENDRLEKVQPCETKTTSLSVHIPENAVPCTHKEIVVVAESEFCGATDNDNALIQVVSAYLHAEEPIDLNDPVSTQWHELYPNFSKRYHLTSWEDTNGDGKLSPCDQIGMTDNETGEVDSYHVKDVTVTIFISKKPDYIENMYLDFEGDFENWDNLKKDPVDTQWHEIWPDFSRRYHLMSWEDENLDGVLGPSDQIEMMDKETEEVYAYHVDEVATDIVLCKKLVVHGVEVTVEPGFKEGMPCENLYYDVIVHNTGNVVDNFILSYIPNGWENIWIEPEVLENIAPCENKVATLIVNIPDWAEHCTEKEIVVIAESEICGATDNDNTWAHVVVPTCGVDVTIEPKHKKGTSCTWLTFAVSVHNTGDIEDNYLLWVVPDGWPMENIILENDRLEKVQPCETRTTSLYVHIPENAMPCTMPYTHKEIVVVAKSEFCGATDNDNALVQVVPRYLHSREGLIDLENSDRFMNSQWHELYPNYCDNYSLTSWVDTGEPYGVLSPCDTIEITNVENENVVHWHHVKDVTVTILISLKPYFDENMYVELEGDFENWDNLKKDPVDTQWHEIWPVFSRRYHLMSWDDNGDNVLGPSDQIEMKDNETGVVYGYHVDEVATDLVLCKKLVVHGVEVTVEPGFKEGMPCTWLEYTVTVTNTGNVMDNYDLSLSDNAGWGDNIQLENVTLAVPVGENGITTLRVHIPDNAFPGTNDNITVIATSTENAEVSDNASCIARALVGGVEVSIFPEDKSGPPAPIPYDVTIKNTGEYEDNYVLKASDNAGWELAFSETSTGPRENSITLTIASGGSSIAYLWVAIPGDAQDGTEDNVTVTATSEVYPAVTDSASCVTRVFIDIKVDVDLSPESNSDAPGKTLTYTVMVTNMGNVKDNYALTVNENAVPSWSPTVSPTSLLISAGEPDTANLTVIIPSDATHGDSRRITITATSSKDTTVRDNASCIASAVVVRDVRVSIPDERWPVLPGAKLDYTITIINEGNVADNYALTVNDNAGWKPTVSPASLSLAADATGEVTLTVTIPDNASLDAKDEITVRATSKTDSTVSDSATFTAEATALRRVKVFISPENKSGAPGENVTFTVMVKNTGNVEDNYALTKSDDAGWVDNITLSENLLEVPPGENKTTTLSVTVPDNAVPCTRDNVTVTATSTENAEVSAENSCTAHAVAALPPTPPERGVQVLISPENQRGLPDETLAFTVTVKNTGEAEDNYDLTVSDNAGWGATLAENLLTIPTGENRTTTVSVTVPSDAIENESTGITVTATSRGDPAKSDSATCTAQAAALRRVEVSVSPGSKIGDPGETLTHTVLVKNTGSIDDTYTLSAVGEAGWSVSIEPTSLTLAAGASGTATLTVVVPPDADEGTFTVDVSAISVGDPAVTGSYTCSTIVTGVPAKPGVELPLPLAISAFLIGAAILIPTYLLRGRPKKAARRRVLRDVSFGFRGRPKKAARRRVLRDVSFGLR